MDLNDPFEMRPAWTDAHEKRRHEDEARKNEMLEGIPVLAAMKDGTAPCIGTMPKRTQKPVTSVESHRGIADGLNGHVFQLLHNHYRVLSFSTGILDLENSHAESDENTTLMWAHYADSFQGVCLAFDSSQFENGLKQGGVAVDYSPNRVGLPPSFYDVFSKMTGDRGVFQGFCFEADPDTGLLLTQQVREEKLEEHLINFLSKKSPAWKYEKEALMIYGLNKTRSSANFTQLQFACNICRKASKTADQCGNATYRDVLRWPAQAIRAVIFGTDINVPEMTAILALLNTPEFAHVAIYWTSLHSDKYVLQYSRDDRSKGDIYSTFIQDNRARQMANAKGHTGFRDDGTGYFVRAKKTLNYVMAPNGACAGSC